MPFDIGVDLGQVSFIRVRIPPELGVCPFSTFADMVEMKLPDTGNIQTALFCRMLECQNYIDLQMILNVRGHLKV